MPPVGICAGGVGRPTSLPRPWPKLKEEYISKMEDELETYGEAYDPAEPVICSGEKPITPACRCSAHLLSQAGPRSATG